MSDLVVVGCGVIGLGIAWRCAQKGMAVTVVDPSPGAGASSAAAGMLAPVAELHVGEEPLLRLNLDSAARYPGFVEDLVAASDQDVGYLRCGTVIVGWDAADLAAMSDLRGHAATLGQAMELLSAVQLRERVPDLAAGPPGGLFAPNDHQVDNRRLHQALLIAAQRLGVTLVRSTVVRVDIAHDRVGGVGLIDGRRLPADWVVLAAGAWSGRIVGMPRSALPQVFPVKGQTLRLRLDEPVLPHVVRGTVRGSSVYLVPRSDGEVVVGASSEEAGFDLRPRAGAMYELLRDAQSLVPALAEAEFLEVATSVRPGSADNAPLIGHTDIGGLVVATGHYRNGILLTPVTADGVAALIDGDHPLDILKPFSPQRFRSAKETSWT